MSRNSKRCSECLTTTKTGFFPSKSSKKYLLCWEDQVSLMYNSEQEKEKSEMKKTVQGSSEVAERVARSISADPTELSVSFNEYL